MNTKNGEQFNYFFFFQSLAYFHFADKETETSIVRWPCNKSYRLQGWIWKDGFAFLRLDALSYVHQMKVLEIDFSSNSFPGSNSLSYLHKWRRRLSLDSAWCECCKELLAMSLEKHDGERGAQNFHHRPSSFCILHLFSHLLHVVVQICNVYKIWWLLFFFLSPVSHLSNSPMHPY